MGVPITVYIDGTDETSDETMSFYNFAMPMMGQVDSRMMKRENDYVSGAKSYFETVST